MFPRESVSVLLVVQCDFCRRICNTTMAVSHRFREAKCCRSSLNLNVSRDRHDVGFISIPNKNDLRCSHILGEDVIT
jgi:hypothetical protein